MMDGAFLVSDYESEAMRPAVILAIAFKRYEYILDIIKIIMLCIAFIVNLFHILILSRKQMRSSSVNVLMIGLAISDMIYFLIDFAYSISYYLPRNNCVRFASYYRMVYSYVTLIILNLVRRLSPWIGVIMAFTRLLVSSYPFNNTIGKLSNSPFAVWSLLSSFLVSTLIESDTYAFYEVRADFSYFPDKSCGFPKNYSQPIYGIQNYRWVKDFPNVELVFRYITFIFKYLPTVILPFMTFGLVKVLRNIKDSKQRLHTNSKDSTYQTTRLVTIMTCCLVVTEVSTGLVSFISISSSELVDMVAHATIIILSILNQVFFLLYPMNSMAHCFITWFLSSQYRSCAKSLFPCLKIIEKKAKVESAPASFQSANNGFKGGLASVS